MDWIPVEDRLPDCEDVRKYEVKMLVGSISAREVETVVLGKLYPSGFRFMSGDWQRVTHWRELKDG